MVNVAIDEYLREVNMANILEQFFENTGRAVGGVLNDFQEATEVNDDVPLGNIALGALMGFAIGGPAGAATGASAAAIGVATEEVAEEAGAEQEEARLLGSVASIGAGVGFGSAGTFEGVGAATATEAVGATPPEFAVPAPDISESALALNDLAIDNSVNLMTEHFADLKNIRPDLSSALLDGKEGYKSIVDSGIKTSSNIPLQDVKVTSGNLNTFTDIGEVDNLMPFNVEPTGLAIELEKPGVNNLLSPTTVDTSFNLDRPELLNSEILNQRDLEAVNNIAKDLDMNNWDRTIGTKLKGLGNENYQAKIDSFNKALEAEGLTDSKFTNFDTGVQNTEYGIQAASALSDFFAEPAYQGGSGFVASQVTPEASQAAYLETFSPQIQQATGSGVQNYEQVVNATLYGGGSPDYLARYQSLFPSAININI